MQFFGGAEMALVYTMPGSNDDRVHRQGKFARVLAEEVISDNPRACLRSKRVYALDDLGILLALDAVESYDPHYYQNWPMPRGSQRIVGARVVHVPNDEAYWAPYRGHCETHGEYSVSLVTPDTGLQGMCGCCGLLHILERALDKATA